MGLFDVFRRKKEIVPAIPRREHLEKTGRITDGIIIDSETNENGEEIVRFFYSVGGVDFESSEILNVEQRKNLLKYAPGARVAIRFDPKQPGNSMLT